MLRKILLALVALAAIALSFWSVYQASRAIGGYELSLWWVSGILLWFFAFLTANGINTDPGKIKHG